MRTTDIAAEVRHFIDDNFLFGEGGDSLADDTSLLEAGLVDSTGILELVAFLERTFAIEVADAEIIPENLDSIAAIVAYVSARERAAAPAAA